MEGFRPGGWVVQGQFVAGAVLISAKAAWALGDATVDTVAIEQLALLSSLDPSPDLLLIGTGTTMRRPPRALLDAARAAGLAPEFMDSRAAARTYNVLVNEGRRVAVLLT